MYHQVFLSLHVTQHAMNIPNDDKSYCPYKTAAESLPNSCSTWPPRSSVSVCCSNEECYEYRSDESTKTLVHGCIKHCIDCLTCSIERDLQHRAPVRSQDLSRVLEAHKNGALRLQNCKQRQPSFSREATKFVAWRGKSCRVVLPTSSRDAK